jgi:hypothetical protein
MFRFLIGVAVGIYLAQEFPDKVPLMRKLIEKGLSKINVTLGTGRDKPISDKKEE